MKKLLTFTAIISLLPLIGFTRNFNTDWDQETSWYLNTNFVYWG